jgi:hypothetical protein
MNENGLDVYADGEKPLVFYYNRAERLSRTPQNVRDYYAGKSEMPKGLFKVLVASKFSRFMLVSVALLSIAFVFLARTTSDASSGTVAGIPATASAFSFDGGIYVSIELKAAAGFVVAVPVTARVNFLGNDKKIIGSSVIGGIYAGKQEFLRTTFTDYDIMEIVVLLRVGDESSTLNAKVIHK